MSLRIRCGNCGTLCIVPDKLRAVSPHCARCSAVLSLPPVSLATAPSGDNDSPSSSNKQAPEALRVHPAVWAAIGGGIVAILSLVVGLMVISDVGQDDRSKAEATSSAGSVIRPDMNRAVTSDSQSTAMSASADVKTSPAEYNSDLSLA
jgi:hypothetical protein